MSKIGSMFLIALLVPALPAFAQSGTRPPAPPPAPSTFSRGWVDVDFGVGQTTKSALDSTFHTTISLETATFTTVYSQGNGTLFDVGGGYLFSRKFGVGASLAMSRHDDSVVMGASIPHPIFFNQNAFDDATTSVKGSEYSINISAVLVAMDTRKMRIRIFGGPSFVTVKQDVINDFSYTQSLVGTTFSITVSPDDPGITKTSTMLPGFHVGGDVAYFFSKVFGIGGVVRYIGTGTKDITDPFALDPNTIGIKGGGLHVAGGVRLRF